MSIRVVEYVFTWPQESCRWRTIVLRTSTSVNVANGSSILTAAYFSSPWRYQFEIFTVCPRTQKLNFPRFLLVCDRLSSCYVCFPVTFGMPLVLSIPAWFKVITSNAFFRIDISRIYFLLKWTNPERHFLKTNSQKGISQIDFSHFFFHNFICFPHFFHFSQFFSFFTFFFQIFPQFFMD